MREFDFKLAHFDGLTMGLRPVFEPNGWGEMGLQKAILEGKLTPYRKTKSEMQDWLVVQKIVQEILKDDEQKKEQLHEQGARQEEENRQSAR